MRLLYCYVQFLNKQGQPAAYRGLKKIELNFSAVDKFSYDSQTNTLERKARNCPLPENFWLNTPSGSEQTTNIYNINVISGENGSGKTTAIHYLIDLLDGLHAAADPAVKDRDRMKTLGLAGNRTLLLLEEAGKQYLLDYAPAAYENVHRFEMRGFSEDRLLIFHCGDARKRFGRPDDGLKSFSALLGRTKVVYMTNTLSQHDYERHIGERNERLRDFFVYDVSLGSTIGPDIAQFFPYEVYKQVCYVFDKVQAEKHLAYRERFPELIMPHALRLHLRMEILKEVDLQRNVDLQILKKQELPYLLSGLCSVAFVENLQSLVNFTSHSLFDAVSLAHDVETVVNDIVNAEKQFQRMLSIIKLEGHIDEVNCIAVLPNGVAVSGSDDNTLCIWNFHSGDHFKTLKGHSAPITCVAVTADGLCVSGSWDKTLCVWDLRSGKKMRTLKGHGGWVTCNTITADGLCISGSLDCTLCIWDFLSGNCIHILKGHRAWVTCVAATASGLCVSGSWDNTLRVWDILSGKNFYLLQGHDSWVTCISVTEDNLCISGSDDCTIRVWELRSGKCLHTLKGHTGRVTCIATTADNLCISGSRDGTLRIWNFRSGDCIHTLCGHRAPVNCVAINEDGFCVSGSDDKTMRVWDLQNYECVYCSREHNSRITCIAPLFDGDVISGDKTGTVIIDRSLVSHNEIQAKARTLRDSCIDYVHFLTEKSDSLLSRFRRIDDRTFELTLDELETMRSKSLLKSNGKHEIDVIEIQEEESAKTLYRDLIMFIQKYVAICKPTYTIDFDWRLSSGEENMLRLFSNLFHIFDLENSGEESVIYNNENHSDEEREKTACDSVLLFMDEADLTMHPEWQRRLISVMTAFLPQLFPTSCAKDMQLILSTHSPLILGDIPGENITYLPSKKKTENDKTLPVPGETFGQNIHTILKESFFLGNGTVGAFAAKKINHLAERLMEIPKQATDNKTSKSELLRELKEMKRNIRVVAPGVLRTRLEQLYRAAEAAVSRPETGGAETDMEKLLSDVQNLSREQRRRLLEELSKERADDD